MLPPLISKRIAFVRPFERFAEVLDAA